MHGPLFFLGFTLLAGGAIARLIFMQSLLQAIKTYFYASFFIGVLFLFQHAEFLGLVQLLLIFPSLAFLVWTGKGVSWSTATYPRPSWPRVVAAGLLFLALFCSAFFMLSSYLRHASFFLPFIAGQLVVASAVSGLVARPEPIFRSLFLSLLLQGAALTLLAVFRDAGQAIPALALLLVTGPFLFGWGVYFHLKKRLH